METKTKITPRQVDITVQKPVKSAVVRREISPFCIATEMASRITGVPAVDYPELRTADGKFIDPAEMNAKGCVFVVMDYDAPLKMNKTHRETKESNPLLNLGIRQQYTVQGLSNIIWQNVINNARDKSENGVETGAKVAKKRSSGIVNFNDCRGVGVKADGSRFYINYVCHQYLSASRYVDANDREYTHEELAPYLPPKDKGVQVQADKHGIPASEYPKYRTMAVDNCKAIRAFGQEFVPTEVKMGMTE